jgi:translation initiation factor 2 beta subunit (eIF-2beta)/eIF-5
MDPGSILDDLARTNSMAVVREIGGDTRRTYQDMWQGLSRSMTPEYVAFVQALAGLTAALFPLQMSIFEAFSRIGREMQATGPAPMRAEDLHAMLGRQYRTRIASGPAVETSEDSTADSWRARVPEEEVTGEEGWQQRATEEVERLYGVDVAAGIPTLQHMKMCLCKAREESNTADQRVLQLQFVRAEATKHRDSVREVLRANDHAAEKVQEPASLAMLALEDLASKSESQLEGAMTEATSCKQRLYVLQQGWTSTVGGASLLPLCGICLQRGVDTACVPCGHTFCHECASKLGKQRNASRYAPPVPCHVCRADVRIKQKVFFS